MDAFYYCVETGRGNKLPRTHNLRGWCIEMKRDRIKLPPKESLKQLYSGRDGYFVKCRLCGEVFPVSLYSRHFINKHYDFVSASVPRTIKLN
ncbi:hypothetical protein SBFV2_gp46 [Sulfolobales Beppu filamentous virus 2]|uniref:Uncharacterized protein n=1 Tax=Sulfolobales Beppu filamentous virus 2 TaxID=2493123 RepID=A0A3Q8Q3T0_9VIRU|nr:hypothetical protein HOU84_gp46 [Sulfolobales Beppu filamentous virus 2]AZI75813.1 hypothetical protein SBFV2_gp46 [Sulfolobales Beppu filamentous virus 2]